MLWKVVLVSFILFSVVFCAADSRSDADSDEEEFVLATVTFAPDDNGTNSEPYDDNKSKMDQWREKIKGVGSKIKGWWHHTKDKLGEKFSTFKQNFKEAAHNVKDYIRNVTEPIRQSWHDLKTDMQERSDVHEQEIQDFKQTLFSQVSPAAGEHQDIELNMGNQSLTQ